MHGHGRRGRRADVQLGAGAIVVRGVVVIVVVDQMMTGLKSRLMVLVLLVVDVGGDRRVRQLRHWRLLRLLNGRWRWRPALRCVRLHDFGDGEFQGNAGGTLMRFVRGHRWRRGSRNDNYGGGGGGGR